VTDEPKAAGELAGALVVLRPVEGGDRQTLRAILADPEVRRWWGPEDLDTAVADLYDDDAHGFAILSGGEIVGYVQYAEEDEPDYRHAGIDIFLGPAGRGRGFGPDAVRTLARYLFEVRGHHRLTIDPAATNERAIGVYERVGFRRVGVMRSYERGQDGEFHDGLLMDMLRGELR
jgi:aminoglycoside 6'-N-acetyltransferase